MVAELPPRWADLLRDTGHRPGDVLGSGMEGTVVDLGGDLVAKIWHRRQAGELETLRTFYDAVAGRPSPTRPKVSGGSASGWPTDGPISWTSVTPLRP
ncbi:MAG: putative aminoglycoside phosphotransferase [Nocardioides sp.]|nr:putative aminoglycoside phosphotransferase [Nocardioides sp.]